MREELYTHVCTACRTPALIQKKRALGGLLQPVVWSILAIIVAIIFAQFGRGRGASPYLMGILGFALVFGGSYYWDQVQRNRARACPSCQSETLIPVSSPEGLRLMKQLGFTES